VDFFTLAKLQTSSQGHNNKAGLPPAPHLGGPVRSYSVLLSSLFWLGMTLSSQSSIKLRHFLE